MFGDSPLRAVQGGEEQGGLLLYGLGHQVFLGKLLFYRLLDDRGGDLQQLRGGLDQVLPVGGAVAVPGNLLQHMPHTGLGAHQGVPGNAQSLGDGIRGLEPDAVDVEGQPVGVLLYPLDRPVTIGLVDAHGTGGADTVGLEEHHDLPHHLLLRPRLVTRSLRLGPMPSNSSSRSGSCSMMSKTCSPKARTSFFAKCGPMPLTMPEPRYFSMPSRVLGGMTRRCWVLN